MVTELDHIMPCTPPTVSQTVSSRAPTSTIVQLLYAAAPSVTFPSLIGHMCETLCGTMGMNARLAVMNGKVAHLEMTHHRLTIALHHNVPGAAACCLTLAIGPNPQSKPTEQTQKLNNAQIIAHQTAIASKLTEAITNRLPADQTLWHITPYILTSALLEDMLTHLPSTLPGPNDTDDKVNLSRVLDQVQITLSGTDVARPNAAPNMPPHQQSADIGFSRRWPAGQLAMGSAAQRKRPRSTPVPPHQMDTIAPAANDTPSLPMPDHTGLLRAHTALHHGKTRSATRLILSAGHASQRVVAFLSHAC